MSKISRFVLILLYLLISVIYVYTGAIHLDEGSYFYAAHAVTKDLMPYRDYFYLQPPLHPYIYGLSQIIVPGFISMRWMSIFLGLIASFTAIRIAGRLGGSTAMTICLALIACNPFQLYFFSIARLYSLTSLFMYLGCYFLISRDRYHMGSAALASLFLTLMTATRLTTLPMLLLGLLFLFVNAKRFLNRVFPIVLSLGLFLIIFYPLARSMSIHQMWFNLLGLNLSLHSFNFMASLALKIRGSSLLIQNYFLVFLLSVPVIARGWQTVKKTNTGNLRSMLFSPKTMLWLMALSILSSQMTAKVYQVSYQTIIMPLFIVLIASEWSTIYEDGHRQSRLMYRFLFISGCILTILAYGRSSIPLVGDKPSIAALREQAEFVRSHSDPSDKIFSADSPLVPTEAGREILTGMAGSDLFPDWSTEKCIQYKVMNFEIMEEYVDNREAKIFVHGVLSFTMGLPHITTISESRRNAFLEKVRSNYDLAATFPSLFIPGTNSYYYIRKEMP
jgi:hypothetical protein